MIHKVHVNRINRLKTVQCIDASNTNLDGKVIGRVRSITQGNYYEDLSDFVNTPKGMVAVRNDNSAIVYLRASRFKVSTTKEYTASLNIPISDTERLQKLIQIHEGAE